MSRPLPPCAVGVVFEFPYPAGADPDRPCRPSHPDDTANLESVLRARWFWERADEAFGGAVVHAGEAMGAFGEDGVRFTVLTDDLPHGYAFEDLIVELHGLYNDPLPANLRAVEHYSTDARGGPYDPVFTYPLTLLGDEELEAERTYHDE